MALGCSPYHRDTEVLYRVLKCLALVVSITKFKTTNEAAVGSSLQLSIFAKKSWVWQALSSFHHSEKHAPSTFPQANLDKTKVVVYAPRWLHCNSSLLSLWLPLPPIATFPSSPALSTTPKECNYCSRWCWHFSKPANKIEPRADTCLLVDKGRSGRHTWPAAEP